MVDYIYYKPESLSLEGSSKGNEPFYIYAILSFVITPEDNTK